MSNVSCDLKSSHAEWLRSSYTRAIEVGRRNLQIAQLMEDYSYLDKLSPDQSRRLVAILEGSSFAEMESDAASLDGGEELFDDYTSDDDCEWPSSSSDSSMPPLVPIDSSIFTVTELDLNNAGGKSFAFPPTASQCALYHRRHNASIPSNSALKPLHTALLWLYPEDEFDPTSFPAEHPEKSDLRTGAVSLQDCISWCISSPLPPNPPVIAHFTALAPSHSNYALSDLKTGFAAPRWSLDWLDTAAKYPSPFYPFDTAVWSPEHDAYQWIHGTPPGAPPSAFEDEDEDEDEEAEREFLKNGLYFQEDSNAPGYMMHGRRCTIAELESIAHEWWSTADELYLQGESVSLGAVVDLNRAYRIATVLQAFEDSGLAQQVPNEVLRMLGGESAPFKPTERRRRA
ncbi:hypothetical protein BCR35DRAFT_334654 [Leucosporidium creatinivorum]|uniref:Uncharacterized protein n=1 Tax=Leucosporidium creatinivorum TaxID=106004 RepID=A0A1Y2DZN2_9BASI|nr:hypothetical protein BCR35DRAFT_334654 [Leucosporidium creatinivorum]